MNGFKTRLTKLVDSAKADVDPFPISHWDEWVKWVKSEGKGFGAFFKGTTEDGAAIENIGRFARGVRGLGYGLMAIGAVFDGMSAGQTADNRHYDTGKKDAYIASHVVLSTGLGFAGAAAGFALGMLIPVPGVDLVVGLALSAALGAAGAAVGDWLADAAFAGIDGNEGQFLHDTWSSVQSFGGGVAQAAGNVASGVTQTVGNAAQTVEHTASNAVRTVENAVSGTANSVESAIVSHLPFGL